MTYRKIPDPPIKQGERVRVLSGTFALHVGKVSTAPQEASKPHGQPIQYGCYVDLGRTGVAFFPYSQLEKLSGDEEVKPWRPENG